MTEHEPIADDETDSDEEHEHDDVLIIAGMMASHTPQQRAGRLIDLLERGDLDEVRAITRARAAATAAAFAKELASLDFE